MNGNKGDLIFFQSNGAIWDKAILLVSPMFTHVGIYTEDGKMIDSNFWRGVKEDKFKLYKGCVICRIKTASEQDIEKMINKMKSFEGQTYDVWGAIWAGILNKLHIPLYRQEKDKMKHCSELVCEGIRAFEPYFGYGRSAETIMPDDIFAWEPIEIIRVVE